jgi:hypothetical protein
MEPGKLTLPASPALDALKKGVRELRGLVDAKNDVEATKAKSQEVFALTEEYAEEQGFPVDEDVPEEEEHPFEGKVMDAIHDIYFVKKEGWEHADMMLKRAEEALGMDGAGEGGRRRRRGKKTRKTKKSKRTTRRRA